MIGSSDPCDLVIVLTLTRRTEMMESFLMGYQMSPTASRTRFSFPAMLLAKAAVLCFSTSVWATSFKEPERHEVRSSSNKFVLDVNPKEKSCIVYSMEDRNKKLWSFPHHVGLSRFFLSDDGKTVAVVAWRYVSVLNLEGDAVELWNAKGRFRAYSFGELVAHPASSGFRGPIGPHWRIWVEKAFVDGGKLKVVTTGPFAYTFDLVSGRIASRSLAATGALSWALGILFLLFAVFIVIRARASEKDAVEDDRNGFYATAAGPVACAVFLWVTLAGVPFVPARIVFYIKLPFLIICLAALVYSFVKCRAIIQSGSKKRWRLLLILSTLLFLGIYSMC